VQDARRLADSLLLRGGGSGRDHEGDSCVQAARAADGSFVIAYLPTGRPVCIKTERLSGATVQARWFDPREGSWHPSPRGSGQHPNTGIQAYAPPSHGERSDWVLVLEDAAKQYPLELPA
jgi:Putative collagen-binding domain of a collagenase